MRPPEECPNCGAEVPRNARACPECGSDHETGWAEDAYASKLDLPDTESEFDYAKYVEKEFGKPSPVPDGIRWYWWLVALILLIAITLWLV